MALRKDVTLTDAQFKADLHSWLAEYNIDLETNILSDLLMKMLVENGINITASTDRFRMYHSSNMFSVDEKNQKIRIARMESITPNQLLQLLSFYQIPADKYIVGNEFSVTVEFFMRKILPEMKSILIHINQHFPQDLVNYQIESRNRLSERALTRITNAIAPFLIACKETVVEEDSTLDKLYGLMGQFNSVAYALSAQNYRFTGDKEVSPEKFTDFIKKFNDLEKRVRRLCQESSALAINHVKEWEQLKTLQAGLDEYAKFNRNQALLAAMNLQPDMNAFLQPIGVHTGFCDIFEHTLLLLAGVKTIPTKSNFDKRYNDPSRITFKLEGLKPAEGEQFIKWFRLQGDVTAGFDKDDQFKMYQMPVGGGESAGPDRGPEYLCEFDVDGEYLYQHIYPMFKEKVYQLLTTQPGWVTPYQDKSLPHFGKIVGAFMVQAVEALEKAAGVALSSEAADLKAALISSMRNVISSISCSDMRKFESALEVFLMELNIAINLPELNSFIREHCAALIHFNGQLAKNILNGVTLKAADAAKPAEKSAGETALPSLSASNSGQLFSARSRESQEEKTRKLMQLKELDKEGVTRQDSVKLSSSM